MQERKRRKEEEGVSLSPRRGMEGERGSQMYRTREEGETEKDMMQQLHEKKGEAGKYGVIKNREQESNTGKKRR